MLTQMTQQKPRILVADDEEYNRLLLLRILQRDYDVDLVVNGQEVLNKLNETEYDAVLLDIMMPVMNGITCLKIIREIVNFASLPIILVSALSDKKNIVQGIELGANDYITKPLDPEIILARLETQVSLKRLMDERNQAVESLQQANQMKIRMMQIASHDLKNPINNLGMVVTLLSGNLEGDAQATQFLEMAQDSIDTMLGIVNEFLAGANHTEGVSAEIEDIYAPEIVENIVHQHKVSAEHKNIDILTDYQADVVILADANRLNQVMNNIVSNAIKYSPKDSQVMIRTLYNHDTWRLEVQDSGAGISEEEQQYLFQAFSKNQISTQPTDGESSTGLGLWIAAEMMRLQDGKIGMDSPDSGGCCFWIELPLSQETLSISA